MVTDCETKSLFRRCGAPGIAICQYCGRSFCSDHGEQLDDGQEICLESSCRRKKEDLARHFAYRAEVTERNRTGICGHEDCELERQVDCAKCDGLFCADHVSEREFMRRDGTPARGLICQHCERRRKLWSRS